MINKRSLISGMVFFVMVFLGTGWGVGFAQVGKGASPQAGPNLEEILTRIEKRYGVSNISALFEQTSVIKALDIRDSATGKIYIQQPGKMRWEYLQPDKQIIISDGVQLWIYRPDDDQVMIGKAPDFFGDGKGASFLSDIRKMRKNFTISLENRPDTDNHVLKLVPLRKGLDLALIYLSVSWANFDIEEIVTYNSYNDETRIALKDAKRGLPLDESLFKFSVPPGVEILHMN
jgi:outer membrane lipoprotein carrier protein